MHLSFIRCVRSAVSLERPSALGCEHRDWERNLIAERSPRGLCGLLAAGPGSLSTSSSKMEFLKHVKWSVDMLLALMLQKRCLDLAL